MATSLVVLAEQKRLPRFQYMDRATLKWIAAQKISSSQVASYPFFGPSELLYLPLESEWFLEHRTATSIHGKRHAHRVSYFCQSLARICRVSDRCMRRVILAGLVHDIRRLDDKGDPAHGERAATWLQEEAFALCAGWGIALGEDDIRAVATAIELHDLSYTAFSAQQILTYEKYKQEVDILKTADALDRYRLPKITWWIHDEHLRLLPPTWLKQMAYELVLESERLYLETKDNNSVLRILDKDRNAHV